MVQAVKESKYAPLKTEHFVWQSHGLTFNESDSILEGHVISREESFLNSANAWLWIYYPPTGETSTQSLEAGFELWLRRLTCLLLLQDVLRENTLLTSFLPLCFYSASFCHSILPYIILHLLKVDPSPNPLRHPHKEYISTVIRKCFKQAATVYKSCVVTWLHVVTVLRGHVRVKTVSNGTKEDEFTKWDSNFWLDLDHMNLARAALVCEDHFTALYHSEVWFEVQGEKQKVLEETKYPDGRKEIEVEVEVEIEKGYHVMAEACSRVGEPDSIYGVESSLNVHEKVQIFEQESKWDKSLLFYDLQCQTSRPGSTEFIAGLSGIVGALRALGCEHVLGEILDYRGIDSRGNTGVGTGPRTISREIMSDLSEQQYEAAWRQGLWGSPSKLGTLRQGVGMERNMGGTVGQPFAGGGFHAHVYQALDLFQKKNFDACLECTSAARRQVVCSLNPASFASTSRVYPTLSRLLILSEIDELGILLGRCSLHDSSDSVLTSTPGQELETILSRWAARAETLEGSWSTREPVLIVRCRLLRAVSTNHPVLRVVAALSLKQHLLAMATFARHHNHFQTAFLASLALKTGSHSYADGKTAHSRGGLIAESTGMDIDDEGMYTIAPEPTPDLNWLLEDAKTYWLQKEETIAKCTLEVLLKKISLGVSDDPRSTTLNILEARAKTLYGHFLSETRSETPDVILSYLKPAAESLFDLMADKQITSPSEHLLLLKETLHAVLTLAQYADAQYQLFVARVQNTDPESSIEEARLELKKLQEEKKKDTSSAHEKKILKQLNCLNKRQEMDLAAKSIAEKSRSLFLYIAVDNYIKCLRLGEDHNTQIFRLCALWFDNDNADPQVATRLKDMKDIKSYKWLPLVYQLAARLNWSATMPPFQLLLQQIVYRLAIDHPHHVIPVLLALKNGNSPGVNSVLSKWTVSGNGGRVTAPSSSSRTLKIATSVGTSETEKKTSFLYIFGKLEELFSCYTTLANVAVKREDTAVLHLPPGFAKFSNATMVGVLTHSLPVNINGDYSDIVSISSFREKYTIAAAGISVPKIVICVGSDGVEYRQVCKGRD